MQSIAKSVIEILVFPLNIVLKKKDFYIKFEIIQTQIKSVNILNAIYDITLQDVVNGLKSNEVQSKYQFHSYSLC